MNTKFHMWLIFSFKIIEKSLLPNIHKNWIQHFLLVTLVGLLSQAVGHLLKPHMKSLPSYVKDTSDFITKIHNLKGIPQNAFLVTLDGTSLYSHDDGIKAFDHLMSEMGKSQAGSVILKLINFVLT